jgi:hypothetical protein
VNGSQAVSVTVGALTNSSLTFTYTDSSNSVPTINSISPTTQNPAIKGLLQIDGTGFGTNQSAVNVFLSNSSGKVYQLSVLSINDTNIVAGLSGGLAGIFTVQVTLPSTTGNSIASPGVDQFQYLFSITSVSPMSGSFNGGTLITITGTNFSPATSDTLVYIGGSLNWFCNIESITTTQITCRTPPISKYYNPGVSERVVISTKLYQFNTCPGNNCNFTYEFSSASPNLTTISQSSANAVSLNVSGLNFISVSTCSISLTSQGDSSIIYPIIATSCNNTFAQFTIPKTVPSSNYYVKVRN